MAKEEKKLQWHAAFYAGLQIELEAEREKLIFENEHQLSTKPLGIDVLVVKKDPDVQIEKNIGRIFRGHNIIEYKSPDDTLTIDDFYKVFAYACLYKADTVKVNEIRAEDITITLVVKHFPRKMLEELQRTSKIMVEKIDEGIYYLKGALFEMQLLQTSKLSKEHNFWLRSLTNDLQEKEDAKALLEEYEKRSQENLYQSMMDIIVKANQELFEEVNGMCEALMEIVKPQVDARVKEAEEKAWSEGREEGRMELTLNLIRKTLAKGMALEEIADMLEQPLETVRSLAKMI